MTDVKYLKFKEVLTKAIGNRSQVKFAREATISDGQLNRMLKNLSIRPSDYSINKIAKIAENGITPKMLRDAREYDEVTYMLTTEELMDVCIGLIIKSFNELASGRPVYDSLDDFVHEALFLYDEKEIKVAIGDIKKNKRENTEAEASSKLALTWCKNGYIRETCIEVLFWQTKGGRVIIDRVI